MDRSVKIVIVVYLIIVSLIGFAIMGIDKSKAKKNQWRIPERNMFLTAACGGAIGVWAGMEYFRHKTKHNKFVYGIPFILFVQVALFIVLIVFKFI